MEPKAQFHIIVGGLKSYIRQKMLQGHGVVIRNFGGFTFEVKTKHKLPAQYFAFDSAKAYEQQRASRNNVHVMRPCFLVDKKFGTALSRFANKSQVDCPKSQSNIFQQGFNMLYCNAGPIASSCSLDREATQSAMNALIQGIIDLTNLGFDLSLDFGVALFRINNKNLKISFKQAFIQQVESVAFDKNMNKKPQSVS